MENILLLLILLNLVYVKEHLKDIKKEIEKK